MKENGKFLLNSEEVMDYEELDEESREKCANMINSNKSVSIN